MTLTKAVAVPAVAMQAYAFFLSKGLTPAQAAGVVGNMLTESSGDPTADNASGHYGLFQWGGGRRDNLQLFAQQNGISMSSVNTQLNFAWYELTNSYPGALTALKSTKSPADAAVTFQYDYEVCCQPGGDCSQCDIQGRINHANAVYTQGTGQTPSQLSSDLTGATAGSAGAGGSSDNPCVVGWNWPSVGPLGGGNVCLWRTSWTRALLGGLLITAGGIMASGALYVLISKTGKSQHIQPVANMLGKIPGPVGRGYSSYTDWVAKRWEPFNTEIEGG